MLALTTVFLVSQVILAAAYPADPVLAKSSEGLRYDYLETDDGELRLVDNWMKLSDFDRLARYDPDTSNVYHLFTRNNYPTSQPLVVNNAATVLGSNYDGSKRTIIIMHGFLGSVTSDVNTVLVPAFLQAGDCNVIVLDWSAGSIWGPRAREAGEAGARFVNWLISLTGGSAENFHSVGFSVGGHGAGILARNVNGNVGYVTGLDPADRWDDDHVININDALYTEIIHTSAALIGITLNLGHADFYPNSGREMPGCFTSLCDHDRSFHYFGESVISGGFTARRCANLHGALSGWCNEPETLQMGGYLPKTGATGIYYLRTNRAQPFSQG